MELAEERIAPTTVVASQSGWAARSSAATPAASGATALVPMASSGTPLVAVVGEGDGARDAAASGAVFWAQAGLVEATMARTSRDCAGISTY